MLWDKELGMYEAWVELALYKAWIDIYYIGELQCVIGCSCTESVPFYLHKHEGAK